MGKSRIENTKKNLIGGMVNRIVSMIMPFLTRTIIIYELGELYLGLNSLYSAILNVLSLAELGFGSAMVFSMYAPLANNDKETVCALLNLYKRIYRYIGIVVILIGTIISPLLPVLIKGSVPNDVNIYVLYFIYLINTSLSYFLFAYKQSILIADQKIGVTNIVATIMKVLSSLLQIISLVLFHDYYLFVIVLPITTIANNLTTNYIVKRMYPSYTARGKLEDNTIGDIKKRVTGVFIYRLCYVFRDSFDGIILSAFLGLAVLGKYNNYLYIVSAITGFTAIIKSSTTASIGNSIAIESEEKNYRDFEAYQLLYMWLSGCCTACLFCLYQPFIKLWVGENYLFDNYTMACFCIYFFTLKMGDICAVYREAAGLWWQDKIRPIVEAVLNLSLNIVLVRLIGVAGVMLSTIICLIFINSIWASRVLFKYYFTSKRQIHYVGKLLFYSLTTIVSCFICYMVCGLVKTNNGVLLLFKNLIICLVISNVFNGVVYAALPEYRHSLNLVKRLVLKR